MDFLTQLWLPIVASAVAVWFISALGWMLINHHSKDMKPLSPAAEEELKGLIVRHGVAPGAYGFPDFQSFKGKSKEEQAALSKKPMGLLRVWKDMGMGRNMALTVVVNLVIGVLIAYLGWEAMGRGASFVKVMQVLGTAGVLAHCFGGMTQNIWYQESRRNMVMCFIDGVIYGMATGAIFAWLWPR